MLDYYLCTVQFTVLFVNVTFSLYIIINIFDFKDFGNMFDDNSVNSIIKLTLLKYIWRCVIFN